MIRSMKYLQILTNSDYEKLSVKTITSAKEVMISSAFISLFVCLFVCLLLCLLLYTAR